MLATRIPDLVSQIITKEFAMSHRKNQVDHVNQRSAKKDKIRRNSERQKELAKALISKYSNLSSKTLDYNNPNLVLGRAEMGSDEESVFNDNASMMSNVSEGSQYKDDLAQNEETAGDDLTQDEVFEEKLREAMDMATQKSANGRTNALKALCTGFFKRYLPDFVEDRRVTLTDIVDKAVKKGKPDEKVAAANLAVMICVELGTSTASEEVFKDLKPLFTTQILDNSVSAKARAALASALGAICFLSSSDLNEFPQVMDTMEAVFKASYNNNVPIKHTEDTLSLHEAALSSWTLLLTLLPPSKAFKLLER